MSEGDVGIICALVESVWTAGLATNWSIKLDEVVGARLSVLSDWNWFVSTSDIYSSDAGRGLSMFDGLFK